MSLFSVLAIVSLPLYSMDSFPSSIKQFSNFIVHVIHLGIVITAVSDSAALRCSPRFCISNRFPGDAATAASEYHTFFFFLIYFWLCWVFVSVRGLSLVAASGGHSSSRCAGLSLSRPLLLVEHRLQTCRLSSCGSRAQLLRSMWDLPRPGLEPVSPALAGRFSTTVPPGKP